MSLCLCVLSDRPLGMSIRVPRKPTFGSRKHGFVRRPGPASKTRSLIIAKCLVDLLARVHHERPILHDWLTDWPTLQQEELALVRPVFKSDCNFSVELYGGVSCERFAADFYGIAAEKVNRPIRTRPGSRHRPLRPRRHFDRPNSDVTLRMRRP